MQRQTVFLVTSDECGWADVRQALKKLPDVSVLEQSSVRNARQAIADCSPGLLLVSPDIARTLLGDQEDGGLPEMDRRLRIAIIGSEPVPMDVLQQAHFELAGQLLWHDLHAGNLRSVLSTLIDTHLILVSLEIADRFLAALHPAPDFPPLTDPERQIVHLLAEGFTNKEIAERESVSERTVERLVTKLFMTLGAHSRFALGVAAARCGLLDPSGE